MLTTDSDDQIEKTIEKVHKAYGITLWRDRLGFNSFFIHIIFGLYIGQFILGNTFLTTWEVYLGANQYLTDLVILAGWVYALYVTKTIHVDFEEMIIQNKLIFHSEETFNNYIEFIRNSYKNKKEVIIPGLLGLLYSIGFLYLFGISSGFAIGGLGGVVLQFEGVEIIFNAITLTVSTIIVGMIFTLVMDALLVIVSTFKCINQLGTSEYPLKVTYKDLKIGAFNIIGKFILSITLPSIIISTFFSVIGLFLILAFGQIFIGYIFIGIGMFITLTLSFLLYKNTTHIHDAISLYKHELKSKLLDFIEVINSQPPGQMDLNLQYKIVYNIHDYYDRIDAANDWPFNPTSIKKLVVTLGSAILPLMLSFISLG